jgi:hypothetical protein
MFHDFFSSYRRAVKFLLRSLSSVKNRCLAWQCQPTMKICQVVLDDKHDITELEDFAKLFELFG